MSWDGVKLVASFQEDHSTRSFTVCEASLVFVVEKMDTVGCLGKHTPTIFPAALEVNKVRELKGQMGIDWHSKETQTYVCMCVRSVYDCVP